MTGIPYNHRQPLVRLSNRQEAFGLDKKSSTLRGTGVQPASKCNMQHHHSKNPYEKSFQNQ